MGKQSISGLMRGLWTLTKKYSPEILTALGITGMISTTVIAVKVTPKAVRQIEEKQKKKGAALTGVEKVKVCWKNYIPPLAIGTVSTLCLIGANSTNMRRNAALMTAYTLSESRLAEYSKKVVDELGEKKEQSIRDSIAQDHVDRTSMKEIIVTGRGSTPCLDLTSGRPFSSDIEFLRQVRNELNFRLIDEMYISLNDFYDAIGLDPTTTGDRLGWNVENGKIDIQFGSHLDKDGIPCLTVDFKTPPRYLD